MVDKPAFFVYGESDGNPYIDQYGDDGAKLASRSAHTMGRHNTLHIPSDGKSVLWTPSANYDYSGLASQFNLTVDHEMSSDKKYHGITGVIDQAAIEDGYHYKLGEIRKGATDLHFTVRLVDDKGMIRQEVEHNFAFNNPAQMKEFLENGTVLNSVSVMGGKGKDADLLATSSGPVITGADVEKAYRYQENQASLTPQMQEAYKRNPFSEIDHRDANLNAVAQSLQSGARPRSPANDVRDDVGATLGYVGLRQGLTDKESYLSSTVRDAIEPKAVAAAVDTTLALGKIEHPANAQDLVAFKQAQAALHFAYAYDDVPGHKGEKEVDGVLGTRTRMAIAGLYKDQHKALPNGGNLTMKTVLDEMGDPKSPLAQSFEKHKVEASALVETASDHGLKREPPMRAAHREYKDQPKHSIDLVGNAGKENASGSHLPGNKSAAEGIVHTKAETPTTEQIVTKPTEETRTAMLDQIKTNAAMRQPLSARSGGHVAGADDARFAAMINPDHFKGVAQMANIDKNKATLPTESKAIAVRKNTEQLAQIGH